MAKRKVLALVIGLIAILLSFKAFAAQDTLVNRNDVFPASGAVSVTSTSVTTYSRSRAVWVGTTQSLDFTFDGTNWITFQGATAGSVIPVQVLGARITSGAAAPAAGDVVFLY